MSQSTLSALSNKSNDFKLDTTADSLTKQQLGEAMQTLNVTSFVERFPQVERRFADPQLDNQKIGLISFVPAKGAKPNEQEFMDLQNCEEILRVKSKRMNKLSD